MNFDDYFARIHRIHSSPLQPIRDHFEGLVNNNVVGESLVAVPFFVDAGLLYFRKDLLQSAGIDASWLDIVQLVPTNDNYRLVAAAETDGASTGAVPRGWRPAQAT